MSEKLPADDSAQADYEATLAEYRSQIDVLDTQLVEMLAARQKVTQKIGTIKRANSLPIYVPERESSLIAKRRAQANEAGVSGDLVEDVLRRAMRDSYYSQHANYARTNSDIHKVVIIGGQGALGKVLVGLFESSDYSVCIIEKDDWSNRTELLSEANLVVLAVPINQTLHHKCLTHLTKKLRAG
jgi:chorismate mutase/prephenate dehydrogenase